MNSNNYEEWEDDDVDARAQLMEDGFEVILDNPGIDCGEWVHCLVQEYPEDVVDVFDDDPEEVYSLLTDWWEMEDYEDIATNLSMSFSEWAATICNESALSLYNELVDAKHRISLLKKALDAATSGSQQG